MNPLVAITISAIVAGPLIAQDTVFLTSGEKRFGRIQRLDSGFFRIEVPLIRRDHHSPPPSHPVTASISLPRNNVSHVEFGIADQLEADLRSGRLPAPLSELWPFWKPFLPIPRSPAAAVGNAFARHLLRKPATRTEALELFILIEKEAWSEEESSAARRGRLEALILLGRAEEAHEEAAQLARITEDPSLLLQANQILGRASESELRKLESEHPRWIEDPHVSPRRMELFHRALDHYLYPALFFGSRTQEAASGLAAALALYREEPDTAAAVEIARDLTTMYPDSPEAGSAQQWLDSLDPELLEPHPENEYQQNEQAHPT